MSIGAHYVFCSGFSFGAEISNLDVFMSVGRCTCSFNADMRSSGLVCLDVEHVVLSQHSLPQEHASTIHETVAAK